MKYMFASDIHGSAYYCNKMSRMSTWCPAFFVVSVFIFATVLRDKVQWGHTVFRFN